MNIRDARICAKMTIKRLSICNCTKYRVGQKTANKTHGYNAVKYYDIIRFQNSFTEI